MKLSELKAGDEVAYFRAHYEKIPCVAKIERVTPQGDLVIYETRFKLINEDDVFRIERSSDRNFNKASIRILTEAYRELAKRSVLISHVSGLRANDLTTDQLQRIADILKEGKG